MKMAKKKGKGKRKKLSQAEKDRRRKDRILKSQKFHEWWSARQNISPIPANPYRAFMIDLSLFAKVHRKDVWRHRTNWTDYPPIDLPTGVPSFKRRLPSRRAERRRFRRIPKAARPIKKTPFMKEIEKEAEELYEKFHIPHVPIRFVPSRGILGRGGVTHYAHGYPLFGVPSHIQLGIRGEEEARVQIVTGLKHEVGHAVHYAYRGEPPKPSLGIITPWGRAFEAEKERTAWRIVDPTLKKKRPLSKWMKKYALGSHLGTIRKVTRVD